MTTTNIKTTPTLPISMQVIGEPKVMGFTILSYLNGREVAILSGVSTVFDKMTKDEIVCRMLMTIHHPRSPTNPSLPFRKQYQRLSILPTNNAKGIYNARPPLRGHMHDVGCLQMSPDGTRALSGAVDNTLKLWNLQTGACLHTLQGHTGQIACLQMSPDGTRAISGSWDATLKLWNLQTGALIQTFEGHTNAVNCLQISPDGTRAISGSSDNTLKLWDLQTGALIQTFEGHTNAVNCLQISPNGTKAISGSADTTLKLWDLQTGALIHDLQEHTHWIRCLQISPDGTRALSGSSDNTLKLWDLQTGALLQTLEGHTHCIARLQMSSDGTRAISGSWDHTLKLWNLQTGALIHTLRGHTSAVNCLQISPDGTRAISGGDDNTLKLWDLQTGAPLQTLEGHTKGIYCLQISPDGTWAISGGDDRTLRIWDFSATTEPILLKTARDFTALSPKALAKAQELFSKLPQGIQNGVYDALYRIQGSLQNVPFECRKLAFQGKDGFKATNEQRIQAIYDYFKATFLRRIRASLEQADSPITFQAAFRRVHPLPEEMQATLRSVFVPKLAEYFREANSPETLNAALTSFSFLPETTRGAIYGELYRILGSPRDVPFNFGELAFHGKDGYSATSEERAQAIFAHFSDVFLKITLAEFQKKNSPEALKAALRRAIQFPTDLQTRILRVVLPRMAHYFEEVDSAEALQELLQIFSLLPTSAQNAIYGELYLVQRSPQNTPFNYGQLAFQGQESFSATNQQRAQAIRTYVDRLSPQGHLEEKESKS